MDSPQVYIALALLLPIVGGLLALASGPAQASKAWLLGIVPGGVMSAMLLYRAVQQPLVIRWEWLPGYEIGWSVDTMGAMLICLVYLISFLVHLFSAHYLQHDKGIHRYYAELGFFTSAMLGLLAADHLLLLFVFWELVGFSSYLLIGFWFQDTAKAKSSREAFMINRVADAGLLIGVVLMVMELNQPFLSELRVQQPTWLVHLAGFGLLIGALGKSAQFPFFGWLPKAMAGPTPVSALIHAATMVAAGVYLLVRVAPVLTPLVLNTAAVIGAVTAFMAAISALTQHDIKKVLAYSTISQLGYMVMGVGVGAWQASLFHLWTHAFFKAGLFLGAGAVIHYLHTLRHSEPGFDAQDMRNMGGLRQALPVAHVTFVVCGLALAGLPFFSGFLSKEGILSGAWLWAIGLAAGGNWLAYFVSGLAFVTALLTPIYIGRQVLLVFYGNPEKETVKLPGMEPIGLVRLPLLVLALGSIWIFHALNPFSTHDWWLGGLMFLQDTPMVGDGAVLRYTLILSIALSVGGVAIGYLFFGPDTKRALAYPSAPVPARWYGLLSFHGWFLEKFYDQISMIYLRIVAFCSLVDKRVIDTLVNGVGVGTVVFSKAMAIIDREIVDGLVNLLAWLSRGLGGVFSKVQDAKVQNQLVWMMVLLLALVLWSQFY